MNWLVDEVVKESPAGEKKHELSELCENLVMLYLSNDSQLHDCCKMEPSNANFDDNIDDYQKRNNSLGIKGKDDWKQFIYSLYQSHQELNSRKSLKVQLQ